VVNKLKAFAVVALLLFFVASNPSGAAAGLRMAGHAVSATANGFGTMLRSLSGGEQ
jgi:hypothetical protein